MKTCRICSETLALAAFSRKADNVDGLQTACKACMSEVAKRWNASNKDRARANQRAHAKSETCRANLQRPEVRARRNAVVSAWRAANPDRVNFHCAKRRAAKLQATPPWADLAKIAEVYRLAAECKALGVECHVDHVVPLQGENVCGLHTHDNLQILLVKENLRKSNKHA